MLFLSRLSAAWEPCGGHVEAAGVDVETMQGCQGWIWELRGGARGGRGSYMGARGGHGDHVGVPEVDVGATWGYWGMDMGVGGSRQLSGAPSLQVGGLRGLACSSYHHEPPGQCLANFGIPGHEHSC